jgi:hypothetical protein
MDLALLEVVGVMGMSASTVLIKNTINRHSGNPYAFGLLSSVVPIILTLIMVSPDRWLTARVVAMMVAGLALAGQRRNGGSHHYDEVLRR